MLLSFLGPILNLVGAPVKSYMEERTTKIKSKAKIAEAKVDAQIKRIAKTADSEVNYDVEALK